MGSQVKDGYDHRVATMNQIQHAFGHLNNNSEGGFLVPEHLVEGLYEELNRQKSKGNKTMTLLETDEWTINLEHMIDFGYSKDEITPELSQGDIYYLTIDITMVNGDEWHLETFESMDRFLRLIGSQKNERSCHTGGEKTLSYYFLKSKEYHDTLEGNEAK